MTNSKVGVRINFKSVKKIFWAYNVIYFKFLQLFLKPICLYFPLIYDMLLQNKYFAMKYYHLSQKMVNLSKIGVNLAFFLEKIDKTNGISLFLENGFCSKQFSWLSMPLLERMKGQTKLFSAKFLKNIFFHKVINILTRTDICSQL